MKSKAKYIFTDIINEYCKSVERPLNFIQVGCNDGKMADPLNGFIIRDKWRGWFIDADKFYLDSALSFYRKELSHFSDENHVFIECGVVTEKEMVEADLKSAYYRKFFSIVPDAIRPRFINHKTDTASVASYGDVAVNLSHPQLNLKDIPRERYNEALCRCNQLDYLQGIGSFDYNFVLNHIHDVVKKDGESGILAQHVFGKDESEHGKFIKMSYVPITTLSDIISQFPYSTIDILQTDMEHWDVKVLGDINSWSRKPSLIHFEAPNGVDDTLRDTMEKCGYSLVKTDRDMMAILYSPSLKDAKL